MTAQNDSGSILHARDFLQRTAPQWLGIAISIVGTVAMLLVVEGLGPDVATKTPVVIFLIPIVVSAYVGGLAPGLLSTALAVLTTEYFLLPPVHSWHVTSRIDVVKLIALAAVGGFVSFLMERSRRPGLKLATVQSESSLPSTESKARGGFWFLLTCLVAIATVSYISVVRMNQDDAWVDQTHQVISNLRMLLATVTDGETGQRGYIITGQESYLEPYHSAVAHTNDVLRQVRDLTADNPLEQQRLKALEPLIAQRMAEFDEGIELRRKQGLEAAQQQLLAGKGKQLHDRIRRAVAEMEETEFMLLHERQARAERDVVLTEVVIIGTGLLALILGGLAQFLVRQGFMASRLSEAELEQRVAERTDELAQANVSLRDSMERLSVSEQQTRLYNLLVYHSRDIILFIRVQDARIVAANAAAETAYGYSREELLALSVYDLRPSDSPEAIRAQLHVADVQGLLFEAIHRRKDGGTFPVEVSSKGETIDGTRTILSVIRDITERKQTEEAARQSELQYRALFDHMSEGLAYCRMVFGNGEGLDFIYLAVNHAFETLTGLKDVTGRRVTEVIPGIREADPGLLETYARVALTGEAEKFEIFVGALGMWFSISAFSPEKGFFVAVFDVITNRKRVEAALRKSRTMFENLFEFTPDALVATDSRGCIVQMNAQAEKSFGYSRTELLGEPVELLVPERYRDGHVGHRQKYYAAPAARAMGTGLELYGRRKDGTEFPADIQLNTIETDEGQLVLNVTRDVTERKQAEREIRRLNAELEQRVRDRTAQLEASNKELEAFAYSVSHDLRAPIRHLSAFSESLRKRSYEKLDERGRHYLDNIHASSQQMGTLIDDLLKFSRLGRAGMSKVDVALEPLVQEVRRELEPEVVGRTVVWKVSTLPEVYADPALLRQVLVNLISNAVKYSRGQQPSQIEIGCTDGTPGERVIFIRDNGVGFEMAYVDKLFKVFQRLHTDFEGTGIGLANVRRIIERHGGRVWAEGVPDQGATFYFSIPIRGGV